MTIRLLIFLTFILSLKMNAQITFEKQYGDIINEVIFSVQQTSDGGYIALGNNIVNGGYSDLYVLKTNNLGDTIWTKHFNWGNNDVGRAIVETTSGFIFTGYSNNINGNGMDNIFLAKLDFNGDSLWRKSYLSNKTEYADDLIETMDGGFIICATKQVALPFNKDIYLIKTDLAGDTIWTKTIGGSNIEFGYAILQTPDSGFVIGGTTKSFGAGGNDGYLVKTNNLGDTLWSKTFGGSGNDFISSIDQTSDGGFILGGYTTSFGAGNNDFYLVRTDASGSALWEKYWGGINSDMGNSVIQTLDSGFLFVGNFINEITSKYELYVIKTNPQGDTLWTNKIIGIGEAHGYSVIQTSDKGYLIGGTTYTQIYTDGMAFLVKLAPEPCDTTYSNIYVTACESYVSPSENYTWTTSNIYTDTIINSTGCDSIITINLTINNITTNAITGMVYFGGSPINAGEVKLLKQDVNNTEIYSKVDDKIINANGYFLFDSLIPGNYLIKAKGDTSLYNNVATYSDSTNKWESAITYTIENGCYDTIKNANINLIPLTFLNGFGSINGQIVLAGVRRTSDPLPGVDVSLEEDPENIIVASTTSDFEGNFTLTNIDTGNYKIIADIAGYTMDTSEVFVFDGSTMGYEIVICVYDSIGEIDVCAKTLTFISKIESSKIFKLYPNPSTEFINLYSEIPNYDIEIVDMTGKVVYYLINQSNNIKIKTPNLNPGIYSVKIRNQGVEYIQKLIIQK